MNFEEAKELYAKGEMSPRCFQQATRFSKKFDPVALWGEDNICLACRQRKRERKLRCERCYIRFRRERERIMLNPVLTDHSISWETIKEIKRLYRQMSFPTTLLKYNNPEIKKIRALYKNYYEVIEMEDFYLREKRDDPKAVS